MDDNINIAFEQQYPLVSFVSVPHPPLHPIALQSISSCCCQCMSFSLNRGIIQSQRTCQISVAEYAVRIPTNFAYKKVSTIRKLSLNKNKKHLGTSFALYFVF